MKLFETYALNDKLKLRNRLVMAPMTTWSGESDGQLSQEELDYYKARSKGVGLVITATTYTVEHGKGFDGQFYAGSDEMIPSLKKLSKVIHQGGAKAILQVFHAGRKSSPKDMPDGITRSASNVPGNREADNIPKAMSIEEIDVLVNSYGDVVKRAYDAGFDGIEIHGANTYLLQQFFSPHANVRTDDYGGTIKKRMKLLLDIVQTTLSVRDEINKDFIIGYRFSPEENHTPGITLEDTKLLLDALCETDLDYLHISLGDYKQSSIRDDYKTNTLKQLIERVDHKKPFIGVGSVFTKEDAEDLLEYEVDMIALGRQLLIDPNTVEKWLEDKTAWTHYDVHKKKNLNIPGPLHERILAYDGWVPIKK